MELAVGREEVRVLLATYSAETHSSYGKVTRELWKRLHAMNPDWEIMQHGWLHVSSEPVPWPIEPTKKAQTPQGSVHIAEDKYGALTFEPLVRRFRPDLVWSIADPFMNEYIPKYMGKYGFKFISHIPVDGAPLPEHWAPGLRGASRVVAVTEYGARVLEPLIGRKEDFIYHGVDTDAFTPYSLEQRRKARPEEANMDADTFVFGYVGHSQWRKQNWNMFMLTRYLLDGSWTRCLGCHRIIPDPLDDITMRPVMPEGYEMCPYCKANTERGTPRRVALWYHTFERANTEFVPTRLKNIWGLDGNVIFSADMKADSGLRDTEMPYLFKMFDAYLALSGGEGFCMPITEAYASGTPVLYTDYSGHGEVGAYAGLAVDYCCLQPNAVEPVNRAIVDMGSALKQALRLIDDRKLYDHHVQLGIKAAREIFSWDVVAQQWSEFIKENAGTRKFQSVGYSL